MGASFLREADKRMLGDLCNKIDSCRRERKFSYGKLAAMSRVQVDTVLRMIQNEGGTIRTLLRLIDAMDYDVVFVKRPQRRNMFAVPGAKEQLTKTRSYSAKSKRKKRAEVRSIKQEIEQAEFEQDFLNQ